ncbi:hypothetical protein TanjilG_16648 [Lupinus angustifolius]|uniref:Glycosyltransferase n=1 Tax=Lupinus angustifolius TaxID=3871 RepID=A0A4P1QZI9_LUPAN|nr:PREDICTED: anthocyanidin 3-O-glucosyltransferase 2-like [Lupinus angustifolius]OIV98321.1 hypothetical protein TanjilG_16648 [Lupinus angustifolius]
MTRIELVFIATPAIGNLVPVVEFANLLTKQDPRFSATVLIITVPHRPLITTYSNSISSSSTNFRFLHLPTVDPPAPDQYQSNVGFFSLLVEKQKHHVKHALIDLTKTESPSDSDSVQLGALFVDMFTTAAIDVAAELNLPSYLFFASPATFLGFTLHLSQIETELTESKTESTESKTESFPFPCFKNSLPRSVFPKLLSNENNGSSWISHHARRYRETKGIIVNTIEELEPHALESLHMDSQLPRVYPIGPVLDLDGSARWDPNPVQYKRIMEWLDMQAKSSVVFLCFGSMGSLSAGQVAQIAIGLEQAGFRFLWALREPPKAQLEDPKDYTNYSNILPDGFLERTAEIGLVCGWVPQAKVLAHKAIGGFVSHCGWNSILESLWYEVPIATWPIYAEQHLNAFEMVKELGLAVEIRLDYRDGGDLVKGEEVERCVRYLMNGCDEIRSKVKEMSEKCKGSLMKNGSSYVNLVSLIEELTS